MGEACIPSLMQERLGVGQGSVQLNSVPGSTPRAQALFFEHLDRPPGGWRIVVLGLSAYDDDALSEDLTQRELDLALLAPLLSLGDAVDLAAEFKAFRQRRQLWLAAGTKIYAWRNDIRSFLHSPLGHLAAARRGYWWLTAEREYVGPTDSLHGVRVEDGVLVGIEDLPSTVVAGLRELRRSTPGFDNAAYRRRWIGRLAESVLAQDGVLVIVRMPTQIVPRVAARAPNTVVLDALGDRPGVFVVDRELMSELELPEFFYDAVHLNRSGGERFTELLAAWLRRELGERLVR